MTPEMLNLQWNAVSLYPAGYYTRRIPAQASVKLPAGWQAGTALEVASREGDTIHTENSHKYGPRGGRMLLLAGGWTPIGEWTDEARDFTVILAEAQPNRFAP